MSVKTNFFTLLENILDKFRGIFKTLPKVEDKDFSEKLETISSFSHQLVAYNSLSFENLKIKPI